MTNRLQEKYQKEIAPTLQKELGIKNKFAVPKIKKVVVHMGVADPQDPRARKKAIENIVEQFKVITGQIPKVTVAKKAIANFKLREGDPLGVMVTLRGAKMWQFLDKFISITLPRVKDFRGVSLTAFDGHGNCSLGLEEQIVFTEIKYDKIERIRGLQVNIIMSTNDDNHARMLLKALGIPFEKKEVKK